jgi:hypothetical protein
VVLTVATGAGRELSIGRSTLLYVPDREYGEIPGYPEGYEFRSRRELAAAGVHRPFQAGISGS